jgi:hypothetical protein
MSLEHLNLADPNANGDGLEAPPNEPEYAQLYDHDPPAPIDPRSFVSHYHDDDVVSNQLCCAMSWVVSGPASDMPNGIYCWSWGLPYLLLGFFVRN